jgi:hypothetical protein
MGKLAKSDLPATTIGTSLKLFYIDIEQAFLGGSYQSDLLISALVHAFKPLSKDICMGKNIPTSGIRY